MNFGMITLNVNLVIKHGDAIQIQISLLCILKTDEFYKDFANNIERQLDTSNYDEKDKRPLPIGKKKKMIGMFKNELGGKIMTEFCALRAKEY